MCDAKHLTCRGTIEKPDMEFIRLLFTDPIEEKVAHRWASRLAGLVGAKALELRPGTTLGEMLLWAAKTGVDSIDFVVVFEPDLRMQLSQFLEDSEQATFREMVQYYTSHFGS